MIGALERTKNNIFMFKNWQTCSGRSLLFQDLCFLTILKKDKHCKVISKVFDLRMSIVNYFWKMCLTPFNLYPENWFEGYPVKSTQISFRVAAWKKLGVILINQKKNQVSTLTKIWVDFTGSPSNHFSGCRLNGRK